MKVNKQISQAATLWHPNYRVVAKLPDTKVIRTAFAINAAAVALVLLTAAFFLRREMQVAEVYTQVATWDARIQESVPKYTQATGLQREFSDAEKRLREIEGFVATDFYASQFLRRIANTLPRFFTITQIQMHGLEVRLNGLIGGPSNKATDIATAYVNQLKSDPVLLDQMQGGMTYSINRELEANRWVFAVDMRLKPHK